MEDPKSQYSRWVVDLSGGWVMINFILIFSSYEKKEKIFKEKFKSEKKMTLFTIFVGKQLFQTIFKWLTIWMLCHIAP